MFERVISTVAPYPAVDHKQPFMKLSLRSRWGFESASPLLVNLAIEMVLTSLRYLSNGF